MSSPRKERLADEFCHVSKFGNEEPADASYEKLSKLLDTSPGSYLDACEFRIDGFWYIAAFGSPADGDLEDNVKGILSAGEPRKLRLEVLEEMTQRRAAIARLGDHVKVRHPNLDIVSIRLSSDQGFEHFPKQLRLLLSRIIR